MATQKSKLTIVADAERLREIGMSDRNSQNPYTVTEAKKNEGGSVIDIAERTRQTGISGYNSQNQYGLNNM